MNFWHALSRKYFGQRSKRLEAQFELTEAYRRVFLTNPSRADQQIVLADMAVQAGWQQITTPGVASDRLWFNEGKRAMFECMFRHLSLSDADVAGLENAVKHETQGRADFNFTNLPDET